MPRFAANLTMMFNEVAFLERFAQAANVGFKGVEFLFPYEFAAEAVAERLHQNNLQQALFNMPPGDWGAGERGLACIPGREGEFEDNLETALSYAKTVGCKQLHMMAGILPDTCSHQQATDTFIANLQLAATICRPHGITILIEPINDRDMPGYFLHHQAQAIDLLKQAQHPNTALQMDLYHCQITQGEVKNHIRNNFASIGHFQIAGVPGRHEPVRGEINYPAIFDLIDNLNFSGWVGCEYHPATHTLACLGWATPYAIGQEQ